MKEGIITGTPDQRRDIIENQVIQEVDQGVDQLHIVRGEVYFLWDWS